jgi:hypothetical protein
MPEDMRKWRAGGGAARSATCLSAWEGRRRSTGPVPGTEPEADPGRVAPGIGVTQMNAAERAGMCNH